MTENQELKVRLLEMCQANVGIARDAYKFVMEEDNEELKGKIQDGIYLIKKDGSHVLFTPNCNKEDCVAVGVKLGSKSIAVALKDVADGRNITLTKCDDETNYSGYINDCDNAVSDWNGKSNTEHLKEIGLNKEIKLVGNEYLPSVGELYFIYLHKKSINEALRAVGGNLISETWYWSSTEYNSTGAWYLRLYYGVIECGTKSRVKSRVRPVSAFNG